MKSETRSRGSVAGARSVLLSGLVWRTCWGGWREVALAGRTGAVPGRYIGSRGEARNSTIMTPAEGLLLAVSEAELQGLEEQCLYMKTR